MHITEMIAFEDDEHRKKELKEMWRGIMTAHHDWVQETQLNHPGSISQYEKRLENGMVSHLAQVSSLKRLIQLNPTRSNIDTGSSRTPRAYS